MEFYKKKIECILNESKTEIINYYKLYFLNKNKRIKKNIKKNTKYNFKIFKNNKWTDLNHFKELLNLLEKPILIEKLHSTSTLGEYDYYKSTMFISIQFRSFDEIISTCIHELTHQLLPKIYNNTHNNDHCQLFKELNYILNLSAVRLQLLNINSKLKKDFNELTTKEQIEYCYLYSRI